MPFGGVTPIPVDIQTAPFAIYATKEYSKEGMVWMVKQTTQLSKKLRILERMIQSGIRTEDDFKQITPQSLAKLDDLSFDDVLLVHEMQESVKKGRLLSFLAAGEVS